MAVLCLRFCARAFSGCGKRGPLFIAVRGPLTIAASLVVEHRLQTRKLSNCVSRAQLFRGMWDLPRPGLEPVSPALADGFLSTAPPGKRQVGWSYAERWRYIFLLNLGGACPGADIIFLYSCSFIFWTSFYLEPGCEVLLKFPCEKMLLNLSIHQAWSLGNICTKCTYEEAETIKLCFLLVTVKEHDEFIVILTSQLSAILHTVVT